MLQCFTYCRCYIDVSDMPIRAHSYMGDKEYEDVWKSVDTRRITLCPKHIRQARKEMTKQNKKRNQKTLGGVVIGAVIMWLLSRHYSKEEVKQFLDKHVFKSEGQEDNDNG